MKKMWLGIQSVCATLLVASTAMAQEAGSNAQDVGKFAALAAGLAIGIAAAGCGLGQGRAGTSSVSSYASFNIEPVSRIFGIGSDRRTDRHHPAGGRRPVASGRTTHRTRRVPRQD